MSIIDTMYYSSHRLNNPPKVFFLVFTADTFIFYNQVVRLHTINGSILSICNEIITKKISEANRQIILQIYQRRNEEVTF